MTPLYNSILSLIFLIVGGGCLGIMMAQFGGRKFANPDRAKQLHRILGWTYVVLFITLFAVMVNRSEQYWETSPPSVAIHVSLSIALCFFLAVKVLIPRHLPGLAKHLFLFGVTAYLLGFVLVGITAGYYVLQTARGMPYISHAELPEKMADPRMGMELLISKCSTCHFIQTILAPRQPSEWEKIINRMVKLASPRIRPTEASIILQYLSQQFVPQKSISEAEATPISKHCTQCHRPEETAKWQFDRKGWAEAVRKMSKLNPDIIPPDKIEDIADSLARGKF
ncbi:MAG: hypothetical protein CSYNP_02961 [Syntrophus sp. SKADARSKE-3]|nr:hypothetical protein [Syntrophus sp. SKADARSKE-3]